jgi:hypothetical protein
MSDFLQTKRELKKLKKILGKRGKRKKDKKAPLKIREKKERIKRKIAKRSRAKNRGK